MGIIVDEEMKGNIIRAARKSDGIIII